MEILIANGRVLGTTSFTTGFIPCKRPPKKMSEDDIMAMALWLERHGRTDEGLLLIERWIAGFVLYFH